MHVDPDTLERSLSELAAPSGEIEDLGGVVARVIAGAGTLLGVTGVGLMLFDPDAGALRYVASTDETARALELAQETADEGPCVESYLSCKPVRTDDIQADKRWPQLGRALGPTGVRAVIGVPLRANGDAVGSLNAYALEPREWDTTETDALAAYGRVLETAVTSTLLAHENSRQSQLVDQLQAALDQRVRIERAIGVLMEREQTDSAGAFSALRSAARSSRRRVVDLADELLEGTTSSASES